MNKIPTLFVRDFEHSNGRYVTVERIHLQVHLSQRPPVRVPDV